MSSSDLRPRFLLPRLRDTLADTSIAVIQGARQVGKSTLAQVVLDEVRGTFVTLDDETERRAAEFDPVTFLRREPDGLLVIDSVQRAPGLVLALKSVVDSDPRPGRFLLTGSADLPRLPTVEDSLAGRAESIELFGFSQGELGTHVEHFVDRLLNHDLPADHTSTLGRPDYLERACAGSYPPVIACETARRRNAWLDNYLRRIVARDADDVSNLARLSVLPGLLRLLAARTSTELIVSGLAGEIGMPERTLPPYIDLLETLYLVQRLPAWSTNLSKRVVSRPKVSLVDTGLAGRLLNVDARGAGPLGDPEIAGQLIEPFVGSELRRQLGWADEAPMLHHFRDRSGLAVDLVLETLDGRVAAIEVMSSSSVGRKDIRGLASLRDRLGDRFVAGVVLHTGPNSVPFGERITAMPMDILWEA